MPAWAYRFQDEFHCPDYFKDPGRGQLLVRLVNLRHGAELALAADRHGLWWVRPTIEIGDRDRRSLQDRLFGRPRNAAVADEEARLDSHVKSAYDAAQAAIDQYRKAREAWEQAAHQLPYYAEWAIRRAAPPGQGTPGFPATPLPASLDVALRELDGLAGALGPPRVDGGQADDDAIVNAIDDQLRKLAGATGKMNDARRALEEDFKRATDSYVTGGAPGWIELDAALRVPLIDSAKRELLLKSLLALRETVDDIGSPAGGDGEPEAGSPIDRGFWVRAAGLARFDLGLRRLDHRPAAGEVPEEDAAIKGIWNAVRGSNDRAVAPETLPGFDPINKIVGRLRGEARSRLVATAADDPDREMSDAERELRARDRESRLITATEVDTLLSGTDRPARDYDRLADSACLEFHLARLRQDYAEDRSLKELAGRANDPRESLGIKRATSPATASGALTVNVAPQGPRAIEGKDWKTEFKLNVAAPPGNAREPRSIPPGEAFVGLVGAADGLTANDQPLGFVPGGRVRVPLDPLTQREVKFKIVQGDKVTLAGDSDTLALDGKIFYRGRVDLADPVRVAVVPRKIDRRIAFRISQDQEKLKAKYPNADRQIPDQFENHQDKGFMHKGKDLDYVIEIENKTPRPMTVVCRHYLVDDMTMAKAETLPPVEGLVLQPGASLPVFRGRVQASDAPNRSPHLRVEVAEVKGQGEIPPFNVVFKEIDWRSYMKIEKSFDPKHDFIDDKGVKQVGLCFLVTMRRPEDDPVTEPIAADQLRCQFSAANLEPQALTGADQGGNNGSGPAGRSSSISRCKA